MPEVLSIEKYRAAADRFLQVPGVRTARVLRDHPQLDRPAVRVQVGPGYERVPPRVYAAIAECDLGVRPDLSGSQSRPQHWIVVAV